MISLKTFLAAQDAIQYLKQNAHVEGLFRWQGISYIKPKVLHALRRGDRHTLHHLLYPNSDEVARIQEVAVPGTPTVDVQIALACSSALLALLISLPKPIFPLRVQRLVVDGNEGIPAESVAHDALGILKQDLVGRHLSLVSSFLDLLGVVSRNSLSSELGGPSIAASLLPALFQMSSDDMQRWHHPAAIFSELITMAPRYLGPREEIETEEGDDSADFEVYANSPSISPVVQGPTMGVNLPTAYINARRRPRRRSPRRCLLANGVGGPDDLPSMWGTQMQGMLHPVLAGNNQE